MARQQVLAPGEFCADVEWVDGSPHVLVRGELDVHTGAVLWQASRAAVDQCPPGAELVVDLSRLTFIDAAGVGVLVRLGNRLRATGSSLHVKADCPTIRRVFELTQLETLLTAPSG